MSERKCIQCGQTKSLDHFPKFRFGYSSLCFDCYLTPSQQMKQWRKDLDPSEQTIFDRLKKEDRVKIIHGSRSILCNGNHWIPDILPSNADKDDLKIDESWFSERGRENLRRIKWSNTPIEEKKKYFCENCGEEISKDEYEENDGKCEECVYDEEEDELDEDQEFLDRDMW